MAFPIPSCPKCAGVLRPLACDAVRCRCGFEVDGIHLYKTRYMPEGEHAAHLLARGRMVPIPQHEAGARVGRDAAALHEIGWDHRWERWDFGSRLVGPMLTGEVAEAARARAAEIGLLYAGEAPGAMLVLPGGRTLTERHAMYGRAPAGLEYECARRMTDAIVAAHGPGRWWTLAGAVHIVIDDTLAAVCDIGDVRHVALRSLYFHDPEPELVDRMTPGRCLYQFERNQQIEPGLPRYVLTPAQIAAAREQWSARLRAKVAASAAADKARGTSVVVDMEDP